MMTDTPCCHDWMKFDIEEREVENLVKVNGRLESELRRQYRVVYACLRCDDYKYGKWEF